MERLEDRTLLTYSATVVGNDVTFTGDVAADTLTLSTDGGGFLQHNRFTAGDAGFASDIDLVSGDGATVTSMLVNAVTSLAVNAGAGNDIVQLNGLALTAATSVNINGGTNTDTIETITGAVSVGAGSVTFIGETINISSALSATTTASLQATTVNLANNVTAAGGISGTPSIVNVQNTTAQIQDGIDVAGANASVNIAAGSYTGNADATAGGKSVTLSPAGSAAVGQVTLSGNLVLNTGDTLQLAISGPSAATDFDNFVVGGTVTLNGATLAPSISYTPAVNDKLVIVTNNSASAVTGTFNGLAEGSFVTISGQTFQVTYVDTTTANANDIALIKYPGPVSVSYSNGSLIITGTGLDDDITVTVTGTNSVTLTGNGVTNFSGTGISGQSAGPFNVTGALSITMNGGNDRVYLRGLATGTLDSGNVTIDLGTGNDTVTTTDVGTPTTGLTLTGDLSIVGDTGDDTVSLGSATASDTFAANAITINTGAGTTQSVSLNATTAVSNVSITNSGTLLQTAQIGNAVASTVGGNLTITQSGTGNTGGYTATVANTTVNGNVTIQNGNSTGGAASATISTTANRTIAGTTFITNGNNASNTVNLTGTGADLTLTKNITVQNGVATGANAINVNGVTASASSSGSFVNGNAASNGISFGGTRANSFIGMVAATNGNATGSTNAITVNNTGIGKTTNLTNGNAATTNTITVGSTAAVSSGGNLVVKNGAGTTSDTVLISRLTGSADVTISNGVSGAVTVTLGGAGANGITGNLSITNNATTGGSRAVTINNTTVSGRTGVAVNEVGAGTSTLDIGTASAVSITGKLDVQDGTGNSTVTLRNLGVGGFTYNDLGGGADTIDIGNNGAGTTTINGVTRIVTGLGSDTVRAGAVGAVFNNLVVISLGSGNDTLTIGANANSPALSANRYSFDGEVGTDTITVSTLSISDYVVGTVPRKLRHKIANFESIL